MKDILTKINPKFKTQREAILSVLSAPGPGILFNGAQLQATLYLLDEKAAANGHDRLFVFDRFKYGIAAKGIYNLLEDMEDEDLLEIIPGKTYRRFVLKNSGFNEAGISGKPLRELVRHLISLGYSDLMRFLDLTNSKE